MGRVRCDSFYIYLLRVILMWGWVGCMFWIILYLDSFVFDNALPLIGCQSFNTLKQPQSFYFQLYLISIKSKISKSTLFLCQRNFLSNRHPLKSSIPNLATLSSSSPSCFKISSSLSPYQDLTCIPFYFCNLKLLSKLSTKIIFFRLRPTLDKSLIYSPFILIVWCL